MAPIRLVSLCTSAAWGGLEMNVRILQSRFREWSRSAGIILQPGTPLEQAAVDFDLAVIGTDAVRKHHAITRIGHLRKGLRQIDAGALIVHRSQDLPLAVALTRSLRWPLIYMQHMQVGKTKRDVIHRWLFGHIDVWATPLELLRQQALVKTTLREDQMMLVVQGIDTNWYADAPDRQTAREQLGLPSDQWLAGVIGRFDRLKGQHVAIEALARVRETDPTAGLLLVGEATAGEGTAYEESLRRRINELGLIDAIYWRPWQEDVRVAYSALDCLALTSFSETYGMVTLEGMASRLPVIGTDAGGTSEIIVDRESGLLVPPNESAVLADALVRVRTEPTRAASLGETAQQRVASRYSLHCEKREWAAVFDRLGI